MIGPEDIGKPCRIQAAGEFYAYVDGMVGTLEAITADGYALVGAPSEFEDVELSLLVPPSEVFPYAS